MLQELIDTGQVMRTVSLPRGRHRLHAMPTSAGYEVRYEEPYDWDGRRRGLTPFTVLQHTISGTGRLRYESRNYRVNAGDTLLVLVPHNHRYWLNSHCNHHSFVVDCKVHNALGTTLPHSGHRKPNDSGPGHHSRFVRTLIVHHRHKLEAGNSTYFTFPNALPCCSSVGSNPEP